MRFFLITLIFTILIAGCSQNAFSKFDLNKEQELSVSSSQTSKIIFSDSKKVYGIFSALYLNEVKPESFNKNENFYIYVYLKNENSFKKSTLLKKINSSITLNDRFPIKVEELPHANRFSYLTSVNNKWNKYYLITFKTRTENEIEKEIEDSEADTKKIKAMREEITKLNLVFKQDEFSSETLTYKRYIR